MGIAGEASAQIEIASAHKVGIYWSNILSCENQILCIIQNKNYQLKWLSKPEITERWLYQINKRPNMDKEGTREDMSSRATKADTILDTWRGLLENEDRLPANYLWIRRF